MWSLLCGTILRAHFFLVCEEPCFHTSGGQGISLFHDVTYVVFMAVMTEAMVFWVDVPCGMVFGHQHFGGLYCLHLQGSRQHGPPKWWYPNTTLHGTTQKNMTITCSMVWINSQINTQNFLLISIRSGHSVNELYTRKHRGCRKHPYVMDMYRV